EGRGHISGPDATVPPRQRAEPVDISYLADTLLILRYFEVEASVRRAISVLKKRSGAHEDTIRELRFSKDGIQIGEPLEKFREILSGIPEFVQMPKGESEESYYADRR